MKKITTILLTLLLLFINADVIKADDQHVIVDDTIKDTFDIGDYEFLNQELQNIEDKYDISIYFIYDDSIANEEITNYAERFLENHSPSTNNVVLCLNSSYYVFKADGPQENLIYENKEAIFNTYLNTASNINYYEAIIDYYQYVVNLINGETYTTTVPIVENMPRVYDGAGLLSQSEIESLSNSLENLSNKYGADFAVVSTNSTSGADVQDYADDFYDYNGYANNGALFLIDMGSRQVTVSTAGSMIDILNDDVIERIYDDMMGYLQNGDYYRALKCFVEDADYFIERNSQSGSTDYPVTNPKPKPRFTAQNAMLAAFVAALVTLVVYFVLRGQLKSVAVEHFARNYVVDRSFRITGYSDMFITSNVTRSPRPKDDDRGSGHSGGSFSTSHSSHTSSSGSSHGGHSHGF